MAETIFGWSQTAADNGSIDSAINFAEYQNPSTVNDSNRAMMARLAELIADLSPTRSSTGSSNAYAVTTAAADNTYRAGEQITFIPNHTNTDACTLNVDGRGPKAWRPKSGTEFSADNIQEGVPVTAYYSLADDAFYSSAGYYVSAIASGVSLQSITARLPQIGDLVLSMDSSPGAGRIRLTEAVQSVLKSAYPELNSWLSDRSYPWGSTATHFKLPPAAGYFLRFAATSSSIDVGGARLAGITQTDGIKSHTHPASSSSSSSTSLSGATDVHVGSTNMGYTDGPTTSKLVSSLSTITASTTTTTTTTTSAASDAITETRPKNVAFHLDVVASTAQSASQIAVFGFPFAWDTGTSDASPGTGRVRGNNATLASITAIYISTDDGWDVDVSGIFSTLGTGHTIVLSKVGAQANRLVMRLSGAPVSNSGYYTLPVTVDVAAGSFDASDQLAFEYAYGPTGATGATGSDGGFSFNFDSTTTMADPGTGDLRLNHATVSSVTAIAVSALSSATSNPDVSDWVATFDDSTTTAHRGQFVIRKATGGGGTYAVFDVTSAVTDNSTWLTMTVAYIGGNGTFSNADPLLVSFYRTGDKGLDGAGSGTMTSVTAGNGLSTSGVGSSGGSITVSGTLTAIRPVNAQTGTSYTVLSTDHTKLVTLSNASAIAVTLPQATGSFGAGFVFSVENKNSGVATITPTTSTINGVSSLVLSRDQGVDVYSDGTNWQIQNGRGIAGATTTIASASSVDIGGAATNRVSITGTTTISSFGNVPNALSFVSFTGALTLTHNATTLILPSAGNITTAAGDCLTTSSDSSGNFRVLHYTKADGTALVSSSGSGSPSDPQGRLTLTSATPVLTATVSAATTVYYSPYIGRYVPLYGGSSFTMTDVGGELSQATTDSTKSPAACTTNSNYDLFVWNDSGTYRCTRGPAWSSDTSRGTGAGTTELERVLGVYLNKVAITNGPSANRGTYVGTVRTNGSSQVDYILGGVAAGGTAGFIGVWNMYNRISITPEVNDSTSSWSYNSTTVRSMNNSTGNRISFVRGLNEDGVSAALKHNFSGGASGDYVFGISLNSTSALGTSSSYGSFGTSNAPGVATYSALPGLGFHYLQCVEKQITTASSATGFGLVSSLQMHSFSAVLRG